MTYSEKLRSPLWQKKRLEIFERDKYTCQLCHSTDKELHVHHVKYSGPNPWDAPAENLTTLCKDCHKETEDLLNEARFILCGISPRGDALRAILKDDSGNFSGVVSMLSTNEKMQSALSIIHDMSSDAFFKGLKAGESRK